MFGAIFNALASGLQKVSEVTQDVGQRIGLPDWVTGSIAGTFELAGAALGRSSGSGTQTAEATTPNSERNSILGNIGNWISGSGAEVRQTQVATVAEPGMGIPGSRSYNARVYQASPEYAARMASPFEAASVQVPNVGIDAAMAQARAAMAGAMTA